MRTILASLTCLLVTAQAGATTTVDFDDIAATFGVSSVTSHGFAFSFVSPPGSFTVGPGETGSPPYPSNGTNILAPFAGAFTMALASGNAFDFFQVDLGESFQDAVGFTTTQVRITGSLAAGGTVSTDVPLDLVHDGPGPLNDFQTEILPASFRDLSSVDFIPLDGGFGGLFSIDNAVVPEPCMLLLFGTAVLGLAAHGAKLS